MIRVVESRYLTLVSIRDPMKTFASSRLCVSPLFPGSPILACNEFVSQSDQFDENERIRNAQNGLSLRHNATKLYEWTL
jgi:hypothetical protein